MSIKEKHLKEENSWNCIKQQKHIFIFLPCTVSSGLGNKNPEVQKVTVSLQYLCDEKAEFYFETSGEKKKTHSTLETGQILHTFLFLKYKLTYPVLTFLYRLIYFYSLSV